MARYFLHIVDGVNCVTDYEGEEHPSLEAAMREAIQSARELMAGSLRSGRGLHSHQILRIQDALGNTLAEVPFALALAADGD